MHETVSGSGISWTVCKSAHRSKQVTMPAPHHSVFYRPDALSATQPTISKHWRQLSIKTVAIIPRDSLLKNSGKEQLSINWVCVAISHVTLTTLTWGTVAYRKAYAKFEVSKILNCITWPEPRPLQGWFTFRSPGYIFATDAAVWHFKFGSCTIYVYIAIRKHLWPLMPTVC